MSGPMAWGCAAATGTSRFGRNSRSNDLGSSFGPPSRPQSPSLRSASAAGRYRYVALGDHGQSLRERFSSLPFRRREGDGEGFHAVPIRDDPACLCKSGVQGSQRLPVLAVAGHRDHAPRRPFGSSSMFRLQRTCNPARLCRYSPTWLTVLRLG